MLIIRDLKITLGARTLFENASFQVNYGDRVALVGPNGAGKSTLFAIILKQLDPDAGTVEREELICSPRRLKLRPTNRESIRPAVCLRSRRSSLTNC
jgi:ATPase subunit of ABC transporter with duplicated ATPase domains